MYNLLVWNLHVFMISILILMVENDIKTKSYLIYFFISYGD